MSQPISRLLQSVETGPRPRFEPEVEGTILAKLCSAQGAQRGASATAGRRSHQSLN
jgi:hypothetical protein